MGVLAPQHLLEGHRGPTLRLTCRSSREGGGTVALR